MATRSLLLPLLLVVPACGGDDPPLTGPFTGSHQLVRTQTGALSCPANLSDDFASIYTVELEHVADGVIIRSDLGVGVGDPPVGDPPVLLVTINGTDDWGGSADYDLIAEAGAVSGTEAVTLQWNPTPTTTAECEASWTLAPIDEPD